MVRLPDGLAYAIAARAEDGRWRPEKEEEGEGGGRGDMGGMAGSVGAAMVSLAATESERWREVGAVPLVRVWLSRVPDIMIYAPLLSFWFQVVHQCGGESLAELHKIRCAKSYY